jgi:hypothetical protein
MPRSRCEYKLSTCDTFHTIIIQSYHPDLKPLTNLSALELERINQRLMDPKSDIAFLESLIPPLALGGDSLPSIKFQAKSFKRHTSDRWSYGIRSRSVPMSVMLEIYKGLKNLGVEWHKHDGMVLEREAEREREREKEERRRKYRSHEEERQEERRRKREEDEKLRQQAVASVFRIRGRYKQGDLIVSRVY